MTRSLANSRRGMTLLEMLIVLVIMVALSTLLVPSISWMGTQSQHFATIENLGRMRELLLHKYYVDMGELPRPRSSLTTGETPTRQNRPQLVYLFVNPDTHEDGDPNNDFFRPTNVLSGRRWQGPYTLHSGAEYYVTDNDTELTTGTNFTNRYGLGDPETRVGDPTIFDAWGHPLVIQEPDLDGNGVISEQERQHTRLVSAGRNGIINTPPDVLMPTLVERGDDLILFLFRHDEFGDQSLEFTP